MKDQFTEQNPPVEENGYKRTVKADDKNYTFTVGIEIDYEAISKVRAEIIVCEEKIKEVAAKVKEVEASIEECVKKEIGNLIHSKNKLIRKKMKKK